MKRTGLSETVLTCSIKARAEAGDRCVPTRTTSWSVTITGTFAASGAGDCGTARYTPSTILSRRYGDVCAATTPYTDAAIVNTAIAANLHRIAAHYATFRA